MAAILLQHRWTRQPQGPVSLNQQHPLAASMTCLFAGQMSIISDRPSLVQRKSIPVGSDMGLAALEDGLFQRATNTGARQTLEWAAAPPYPFSPQNNELFWMCARIIAPPSCARGVALSFRNTGNGNPIAMVAMGFNGGAGTNGQFVPIVRNDSGSFALSSSGPQINDLKVHTLWVARDGNGNINRCVDSGAYENIGFSPGTITPNPDGSAIFSDPANGTVVSDIGFTVLFSAAGIGYVPPFAVRQMVHEAPWQIFQPMQRRLYVNLPGSPIIPVLSAATVTAITATTARPRVTITF